MFAPYEEAVVLVWSHILKSLSEKWIERLSDAPDCRGVLACSKGSHIYHTRDRVASPGRYTAVPHRTTVHQLRTLSVGPEEFIHDGVLEGRCVQTLPDDEELAHLAFPWAFHL